MRNTLKTFKPFFKFLKFFGIFPFEIRHSGDVLLTFSQTFYSIVFAIFWIGGCVLFLLSSFPQGSELSIATSKVASILPTGHVIFIIVQNFLGRENFRNFLSVLGHVDVRVSFLKN